MARPPFTQARNSIGPNYDFWENKFLNFFVGAVVWFLFHLKYSNCDSEKNYLTIGQVIHKFLKSFWHLLRRTKRGTRSVGFFTKGSPSVLIGPGFFSKCSIFFSKCSIFFSKCSFFFLKMFHFFLKRSIWQRKGRILK